QDYFTLEGFSYKSRPSGTGSRQWRVTWRVKTVPTPSHGGLRLGQGQDRRKRPGCWLRDRRETRKPRAPYMALTGWRRWRTRTTCWQATWSSCRGRRLPPSRGRGASLHCSVGGRLPSCR
ncbi:unnamed protein product, partial [Ascophyllum nodosum]